MKKSRVLSCGGMWVSDAKDSRRSYMNSYFCSRSTYIHPYGVSNHFLTWVTPISIDSWHANGSIMESHVSKFCSPGSNFETVFLRQNVY